MLGFEIFVYRLDLVPDMKKVEGHGAGMLARWMVNMDGLRWLDALVEQGNAYCHSTCQVDRPRARSRNTEDQESSGHRRGLCDAGELVRQGRAGPGPRRHMPARSTALRGSLGPELTMLGAVARV
jgi:hypothetical protein